MTIASMDSETGGPARSVRYLSEYLGRHGNHTQLFVGRRRSEAGGANTVPVFLFRELENLLGSSGRNRETILHSHGIWHPVNHSTASLARRFNVPLIVSPRGMLEPWSLEYKKWKKRLAWLLYQRRDLLSTSVLHATSNQEAENLRRLGLNRPIAVIPNGVQVPREKIAAAATKGVRTALFLSRIHPKKGLVNLVHAWAQVRPEGWRLLIVGPDEGGHRAEVEREVARYNLSDVIEFAGPVDDTEKWQYYADADLFVLPTFSENFGIVVAEALASGVPVITTKGSPWSDLEEYKCGWWIDVGVVPLAEAITNATGLAKSELLSMGERGRRCVARNYTWLRVAEQMLTVYEWVVHGGNRPECIIV